MDPSYAICPTCTLLPALLFGLSFCVGYISTELAERLSVPLCGASRLCDWDLHIGEQGSERLLLHSQPSFSATDCSSALEVQAGWRVQLSPGR